MPLENNRIDSMEHFREYGDSFYDYPFLYYCRKCIRNFSTKVRVKRCNKCQTDEIVELPADIRNVPKSRLSSGIKRPNFLGKFLDKEVFDDESELKEDNISKKMINLKKDLIKARDDFIASLRHIARKYNFLLNRRNSSNEERPSYEYTD